MANIDELTSEGLQTKDNLVLVDELKRDLSDLYSIDGDAINFDSNTPDGQLIEIISLLGSTLREIITEVYNSIDPDKCVGAVQDNRYQINYLTRKGGSYTVQRIAITTNKTVTLQGLDASIEDPESSAYAVSDNNGNVWYLTNTATITSGTTNLYFRAKEMGQVIPTIDTITNQVTIIDGVIKVTNNVGPLDIGVDEESDSDFRIRRAQSVSKSGKNNLDTTITELLELSGITSVNTHQNKSDTTDETGTPAHSVWIIVKGSETNQEKIARIIYENSGGAGTKGNIHVTINSESLQPITINFDEAETIPLYIKFNILPITDAGEIDVDSIKAYIKDNLFYNIGESVETSKITEICADAMLSDGGNGYALDVKVSTGGTATVTVDGTGITAASVDVIDFQYQTQDTAGTYNFVYSNGEWTLGVDTVDLTDYGISYTGTAVDNDEIEVVYTASIWTDYLQPNTIQEEFVTDENKIYTTIIQE